MTLKAGRQVCKLIPTLLPKEVRDAVYACHTYGADCTICIFDVQAVREQVQILIVGALLAPDKRTVTAVLRVQGLEQEPYFQTYHRVLNRAWWSDLSKFSSEDERHYHFQ